MKLSMEYDTIKGIDVGRAASAPSGQACHFTMASTEVLSYGRKGGSAPMRKHEPKKRRSLSLSEQTFPIIEQITAGMPGGFFIYHADEEERLIYANRALFQIYGCKDLEEAKEKVQALIKEQGSKKDDD